MPILRLWRAVALQSPRARALIVVAWHRTRRKTASSHTLLPSFRGHQAVQELDPLTGKVSTQVLPALLREVLSSDFWYSVQE